MKFLFFSKDGASLGIAMRVVQEGHNVKWYCVAKEVGRGLIDCIQNPNAGLEPDTVVVFDSVGYGRRADELRRSGYPVIGGSTFIDTVSLAPEYGAQLLQFAGVGKVDLGGATLGACFNGHDWVAGSVRMIYRDTHFMAGDVGPQLPFTGCAVLYWRQIRPTVFKKTLYKMTKMLREANYVGPVEYVDDKTFKVGLPYGVFDTCASLSSNGIGRILADTARGTIRRVTPSYEYGIACLVTLPPFPSSPMPKRTLYKPVQEIWFHPHDTTCANGDTYTGAVVGLCLASAPSVNKAMEILNGRVKQLDIPDLQYRTDAGSRAARFREWVYSQRIA